MHQASVLALLAVVFTVVSADGIYTKNSPVLRINSKNYDSLIAHSNHTSILEFYAPWCGHCQSLKPAYEKAAKNLAGLAKVAAINCDEESNKPLCGQMGVQGFPTLKIVKPGSKPGKPIVEDYQGARTAKAIVDAVVDKIPNHVKRLQDSGLSAWLFANPENPKAILFSEKGTTSALIRSLAVDFLGVVDFAQIRNKEKATVEKFGITQFPALVLLPGRDKDALTYTEEMKRAPILDFLSQVASPNPDPALKKAKASKSTKSPKKAAESSSTASSSFLKASASHKQADFDDHMEFEDAGTVFLGDNMPTDSPLPVVPPAETPMAIPEAVPAIQILSTSEELASSCLTPKSGNCILVLLPKGSSPEEILPQTATDALASLAEVANKHHRRKAKIFPFYGVSAENEAAKLIRDGLGLKSEAETEVIALNMKRSWWKAYSGEGLHALEDFVDTVKFGEGSKKALPEGFFGTASEDTKASPPEPEPAFAAEQVLDQESLEAPEAEPVAEITHGEL